tara:strand:- start:31 stop:426 length:396 start_codon:yes stop_codon:yes gene_type:complete
MANALKGKTLTTIIMIFPDEKAAEEIEEQMRGVYEFMEAKSYKSGPLKLIHYSISSGPEWKENASFLDGKIPEKTGRLIVNLIEIYESEDGLHHHWIESKEYFPIVEQLLKEIGAELKIYTHQKIIQSLWD